MRENDACLHQHGYVTINLKRMKVQALLMSDMGTWALTFRRYVSYQAHEVSHATAPYQADEVITR
jgi:hypothetical protein